MTNRNAEEHTISVLRESPNSPDALELMAELDKELLARYPAASIHGMEPAEADAFVIARLNGGAVGCAGLRAISEEAVEIKRMFVKAEYRGKGIAREILKELETSAIELGYKRIQLETGDRQPEAMALYESANYNPIPRFGEYGNDPHSRCYEKIL